MQLKYIEPNIESYFQQDLLRIKNLLRDIGTKFYSLNKLA